MRGGMGKPESIVRTLQNEALSRLALLKRFKRKEKLDFLLISDPVDIAYSSGFLSSNALLCIGPENNLLLTDFRYFTEAGAFCRNNTGWKFIPVQNSLFEELSKYIARGTRVGFQSDHLTVEEFGRLKKYLRKVTFTGCAEELARIFIVKRDAEVASMKRAARIGDAALRKLLPSIRPGVSEIDTARKLERYCSDLGSEKPSFDTIVLFGNRSALPHGKPGKTRLKRGMFVLIDFGCTVDGFASDMTRTFICGKASLRQRQIYRTVFDAQQHARKGARAGLKAGALDNLARGPITEAGFGEMFGHALGHGVGRRIHEAPRLSAAVAENIPAGAVVTIEPGIYLPEIGGVRIEDMVLMRPDGIDLLTNFPRELLEL